ncbi:ABC transporter substrate-binding protein [Xylophilus sp.]|uniref:ABC transporter substrate-binding protein n=1 Tax=Xylophilus sp. TaxID=2653893 RepID=UPI0013BD4879|nr:ABC transporter substrate-binding protein [Xylophilus sp.]KAF1044544.1 MAG: Oligopeptide-binding protein AppA [Xylophilus sp.]
MTLSRSLSRLLSAFALASAFAAPHGAFAQTRGGTLNLIVQPEPPLLVSAIQSLAPTQYVAGKIYQGLVRISPTLQPLPELARSWKVSNDGRTYTFDLERDVRWHDGKPFTAADVVFSVDTALPALSSRVRLVKEQHIESVRAIGEHQVEIRLKAPFPAFPLILEVGTLPILPRHIYEGTDYRTNPANQTPIGTGPFVFKEWKKGSFIRLARNNDYWRKGQPYLDGIVFHVIPDSASRAVAFEKGDVQVLRSGDVDNVDIKRLRALPGVSFTTKGSEKFGSVLFLQPNLRNAPLDNVKVRQAIQHALDRRFIIDNIFFGFGKPTTGPFASTTLFHDASVLPAYEYSLDKARQLIRESGVDVSKRPLNLLGAAYGGAWVRLVEYVKQQLEEVGFRVNVVQVDPAGWYKRASDWDFDLALNFHYQHGDPELGVAPLYLASNITKGTPFGNIEGYSNPAADALWAEGGRSIDPAKRQQAYSAVQRIIANDVAVANLFEIENPTLYRSQVKNLVTTGIGLNESFDAVSIEAP